MSIAQSERVAPLLSPKPAATGRPTKRFNRSSFEGDFMVVISGQTAEDFELYAPESQTCEYFDGIIYMPSPVADRHQEYAIFLIDLFNGFRLATGIGRIGMGPGVLRLSPERKAEPDVFIRPTGADEWDPRALLVVEVLSPSNRSHDLEFKRSIYEEAGIPEVWYVDDRDKVLIVVRKVGGAYQVLSMSEGIVVVPSVPGLWIDVAWLWSEPMANPRECLGRILAGLPA